MRNNAEIFALVIGLASAQAAHAGAQCMGTDGAWHDYQSPMCQQSARPEQPAPKTAMDYAEPLPDDLAHPRRYVPPRPVTLAPPSRDAARSAVAIEPGGYVAPEIAGRLEPAVTLVRLLGYRCDSVAGWRACLLGCDFLLRCNGGRYVFEISDRGGKIAVEATR